MSDVMRCPMHGAPLVPLSQKRWEEGPPDPNGYECGCDHGNPQPIRVSETATPVERLRWLSETWLELRASLEGALILLDRIGEFAHGEDCDAFNACENGTYGGSETCVFDEEKDETVHNHHSCDCLVWDAASKAKDIRAVLARTLPTKDIPRRERARATFVVTRTSSARYLGAYEWVRNAPKAAHFITREAAEAAADVARQSNGGVAVEEYTP
jgi:hypothetical protein